MSIVLSDLPKEILEMIADRICCSQGYSSFRLACRKMYWSTRSVKRYHPGGELFEKIPIKKGKPNGISTLFFPDGEIAGTKEYREGLIVNTEKLFYKSGKLLFKGNYNDNTRKGIHFWYNINGTVSKSSDYTINNYEKCLENNRTGELLMTCKYHHGKLNGPVELYIQDIPHITFNYKNGKMTGLITIISLFHTLSFMGSIVDDLPHGNQHLYNEDGDIKAIIPFYNGRKTGLFRKYYDSGNLMSAVNYRNNIRQGVEKIWYETGEIKAIRNWKNGKKSGLCRMYSRSGVTTNKCLFKMDKLDGICIKYSPEGFRENITFYKNGTLIQSIIYYYHTFGDVYQINFSEIDSRHTNYSSFYKDKDGKSVPKILRYEDKHFRYNSNFIRIIDTGNNVKNIINRLGKYCINRFEKNGKTITESITIDTETLTI